MLPFGVIRWTLLCLLKGPMGIGAHDLFGSVAMLSALTLIARGEIGVDTLRGGLGDLVHISTLTQAVMLRRQGFYSQYPAPVL